MSNLKYPLHWPKNYKRTPYNQKKEAAFNVSFAQARDELLQELNRLKVEATAISSNVPLRKDELPYANFKEPNDSGIAVYFKLKSKNYVLCCDKWKLAKDNLRAIGLHVAALRGIERWGVGTAEQTFRGYEALPPKSPKIKKQRTWWEILGVRQEANYDEISKAYREKAKEFHPDLGGETEKMAELNNAWQEAKACINQIK